MEYGKRIKKLQRRLKKHKVDGLLITDLLNIKYLTGFEGSRAFLLVSEGKSLFFTDARYIETAEREIACDEVVKLSKDVRRDIADLAKKSRIRKIGFESQNISYDDYHRFATKIGRKKFTATKDIVEELRMIKDNDEIDKIKKAIRLSERGFKHIRQFLRCGVSEKDIATEFELFLKLNGAEKLAFDTIVAFGRGSSVPHYRTSKRRRLRSGDIVLIDFGAVVEGYTSDLTRTFVSPNITKKEKRIYNLVLEAQRRAIRRVRPGVLLSSIDKAAREYISNNGFSEHFVHSVGHGIGLSVHEMPGISANSKLRCKKGMVFTIEPGIYIPGWGGVRIEDDLLVTQRGCEVLSRLSKKMESFI